MSITITFTDEEARAIESQLKEIEEQRLNSSHTEIKCVERHLDRLEAGRIRFTQAIQETYT